MLNIMLQEIITLPILLTTILTCLRISLVFLIPLQHEMSRAGSHSQKVIILIIFSGA